MSNTLFKVASMMHTNNIRLHERTMANALEKLSSGNRINKAKDDPFRNYETSDMNSKIRNTNKAIINSKDGASLLQVAEGTCNEVHSILQRVRELSVQSANDILTSTERKYLNDEVTELLKEVDRIAVSATFNAKQIFGNKGDSFSDEERDLRRPISDADRELKYWQPFSTKNANDVYFKNQEENDLRYWKPFTTKDENGNELRAGVLHIGPGSTRPDEVKVSIPELSAKSLGLKDLNILYSPLNLTTETLLTYQGVNINSQNGATKAINDIDAAISSVTTIRTYMGVLVNRMERQVEDLASSNISMNDYVAKVKDTDFAKESTTFTASQIQMQAAVSILAQSNSRVGRVVEILGG
ncbi:MAG: flagellin [Fibromonadaceae bacterium]|nr:flagellin [Fibromonadaceae bacterium]